MASPDRPGSIDGPALPDMTAAELALGVLDGEARAQALRRVLAEPDFAREVADWRARLDGLSLNVAEVDPGPDVARRVLGAVGGGAASVALPGRARGTRGWKVATSLSTAAAAVLLGLLVLRPPQIVQVPAQPAPAAELPLVAVIAPQAGEAFSAVYDRASRQVRLTGAVTVPRGRTAELWAIGADGVPRALGLLPNRAGGRVTVRSVDVLPGTTLAISIEPLGGSPEPTPTGPVVATGKLVIA